MSVRNVFLSWRMAGLAVVLLTCLVGTAFAGVVRNVTVSEGPDWVKVDVHGSFDYRVHHLPAGSEGYRSIAVDVWPANIASGMEPKAALPVDFGLVGQVRVRQISGSTVRVYIDVINWPDYQVHRTGSGLQVAMKAFQQKAK